MKTKFNGILTLLLALIVQISFAQDKTISGTVSDESGPLPGVTVLKKGTTQGTETDFDGNYSIKTKTGDVLVFSFVGMKTTQKTVGNSNTINVVLENDNVLEEVVVTALGIKKEKKALGYSVASIKSEEIQGKPTVDVADALTGKVAGVDIISGGSTVGAGANIIIRGYSSITGNNQALIVVDGVPISSASNATNDFDTAYGASSGSRMSDIDQNNIKNIEVLKGLSATVLYGEEGRNGVILITTKTGSSGSSNKKTSVTVNSSVFFSEITGLPEWQDTYGNGFQGSASRAFSNWGAKFSEVSEVPHIYAGNSFQSIQGGGSYADFFPEYVGQSYAYKPYDNVEGFFRTGASIVNSILLNGGGEKSRFSLSYTNSDVEGITPGNAIIRNNLSVGGSANLDNGLVVSGSMNYINSDMKTPPSAASYGSNASAGASSIFANVLYTPRSVDLNGLPWEDSLNRSVYYRTDNSIQNPYWTVNNEKYQESTDRVQGKVSLSYPITDNMNIMYRAGLDSYTLEKTFSVNKGGITFDGLGRLDKEFVRERIWNHDLILTGNQGITSDISLDYTFGLNSKRTNYEQLVANYSDQLVYDGFFSNNFVNRNAGSFYSDTVNKMGVYAAANLSYKNFLYLNLVGRNDWASTHESGNNSLFYPGASISLLPLKAFNIDTNGAVNFLKLRGGYGSSARFAGPYNTRNTLDVRANYWLTGDNTSVNVNNVSNTRGNPNLKPELQTEIEFGIEGKFLKNRVSLDLSVYQRNAKDQIINRQLDASTGVTDMLINAGELETKGIEALLTVTPIKNENFSWDTTFNFGSFESIIVDLPDDVDQISLNGFTNLGNFAKEGEAFNAIMGTTVERDANGNKVVLDNGYWKVDNDISVIGNPNPDYTLTVGNKFKYKNFNLGFQFDFVKGGDVLSYTVASVLARGLTADTDVDRGQTVILGGIRESDGAANATQISLTDYYFDNFLYGAREALIYDATHLKLREISFGYTLTKEQLNNTPFSDVSVSFIANNLWRKAFNMPDAHQGYDPTASSLGVSNSKGLDFMVGPSTKRYGVSLKASF
ncbi:SusC/RagA family TonB-linked outer membrane protein [Tenacibaculum salmonis]|uniref:SusC/RagA family TonB-linked outer membrane protein n=1 Tax=Tenacibaculum sp. P3-BQ1 TaxID=3232310 RepID=UPI0034E045E1